MLQLIHKLTQPFVLHYQACVLSLKNLISTPVCSLMTLLAVTLSFSLPIMSLMTVYNIQNLTENWDTGHTITLYLQKSLTAQESEDLLSTLLKRKEIESGTYSPPEDLLKEFQSWSSLEESLPLLPDNPLPGVITLEPKAAYQKPASLAQLTQSLKHLNEVDNISFDTEGITKLDAVLTLAQALCLILMGLISLGIIIVIANTIRLALNKHKEEVEILNLIGASRAFIRRPFLYGGLWYGLLGAGLSYGLVILLMQPLIPLLQNVAILYNQAFELHFGDAITFGAVLLIGALLGCIGAFMATFRSNHRII